jgi:exopolysaccharide production protein ExoZ
MHPLNQAFLFVGGFLIGYIFKERKINQIRVIGILIASMLLFVFYPASGETSILIYGWNRIALTAICFVVCFCFYKLELKLHEILSIPLHNLGESTYSIYLLHPIMYSCILVFHKLTFSVPKELRIIEAICLTLLMSYLCYRYFEVRFMIIAKNKTIKSVP